MAKEFLANLLKDGKGLPPDWDETRNQLNQAISMHCSEALWTKAYWTETGQCGCETNSAQALALFRPAAVSTSVLALRLAHRTIGMSEKLKWYRVAVDQNYTPAIDELAAYLMDVSRSRIDRHIAQKVAEENPRNSLGFDEARNAQYKELSADLDNLNKAFSWMHEQFWNKGAWSNSVKRAETAPIFGNYYGYYGVI
jgi:hypothetical protein